MLIKKRSISESNPPTRRESGIEEDVDTPMPEQVEDIGSEEDSVSFEQGIRSVSAKIKLSNGFGENEVHLIASGSTVDESLFMFQFLLDNLESGGFNIPIKEGKKKKKRMDAVG